MTRNHALDRVADYFANLAPQRIDQNRGLYSRECGCCVGAHLAYLFGYHALEEAYTYLVGVRMLAERLVWDTSLLRSRLHKCGAPWDPFSDERWQIQPAEVFAELRDRHQDKEPDGPAV